MKAIIDTEWLDQQIEKYDSLLKAAHDDNDYNGYNELSAAQSAFKKVKAQLSPIKEHDKEVFQWLMDKDYLADNKDILFSDYLKQNGYE